jgi:hypothetical protein
MIEDGHFKEMKLILDYVYSKRVEFKKRGLSGQAKQDVDEEPAAVKDSKRLYKEDVLKKGKDV